MSNNCAKCGHSKSDHRGKNFPCFHETEYRPYGSSEKDPPKMQLCSCTNFVKQKKYQAPSKPKLSTVNKLSRPDLEMVNELLVYCIDYYGKLAIPPKKSNLKGGPGFSMGINYDDSEDMVNLKSRILQQSLRIGERLWYPRQSLVPQYGTSLKDRKK